MTDACAVAIGAVSGLGLGEAAYACAEVGEPARTALAHDEALASHGLLRPRCARAPSDLGVTPSADRATDLLRAALARVCDRLDAVMPRWRERRIGVCIGTSSGGMIAAERFFAARARGEAVSREEALRATYFGPFVDALGDIAPHKRCQVLAACASSTIAIGLALRWLDRQACDLVLAGGYDGVSLFVAAGFEALRATSASMPQPFRQGRDGMLLGEGAAVIALTREEDGIAPLFRVSGFGASADAVHITAPDRTGAGLIRAVRAALDDAGCERISLVSAHATATPFNDAAEAKALGELFDPVPVVHPFKAQIGHTLGAAGVLELLAATHALERGVAPAAYGDAPLDPEASVPLLERAEPRSLETTLKLSAAFGGVTAALVAQRHASNRRPSEVRPVSLRAWARIGDEPIDRAALAEALGMPRDKIARIDDLGQLALAAAAALARDVGRDALHGAGVVAGYALATLDTNELFNRRLLDKGPRWVDPRLFPATTPNAGAGQIAIALGLTGPNFAVCSGLASGLEALTVAAELVAAGDAERILVVAADDAGPAARHWVEIAAPGRAQARGAVAALIEAGDSGPRIDPDMAVDHAHGPIGHLALIDALDALRSGGLP
jgi:3-oxoacyl-(acyl-carrier-protein) synthase